MKKLFQLLFIFIVFACNPDAPALKEEVAQLREMAILAQKEAAEQNVLKLQDQLEVCKE